jgi:hypothetical protein
MEFFEKPKISLHLKNQEDYLLAECASNEEAIEIIYRNALRLGMSNIVVVDHENDDYKYSALRLLEAFDLSIKVQLVDTRHEVK